MTMDIKESDVEEKTSRSEFEVKEESKDSPRNEDVPVEDPKDLGEDLAILRRRRSPRTLKRRRSPWTGLRR